MNPQQQPARERTLPLLSFPRTMRFAVRVTEALAALILFPLRFGTRSTSRKTYLILEPFGLGDCVLLTGMLQSIRQMEPDARILVVCAPQWSSLFDGYANVTAYALDFPWTRKKLPLSRYPWLKLLVFIRHLRAQRIDAGFDVRGDVRSQILLLLFGCRRRIGLTRYWASDMTLAGYLLTDAVPGVVEHKIVQNARLLAAAGIATETAGPVLKLGSSPKSDGNRFDLAVSIGASWKYQRWSIENWGRVVERLLQDGKRILILFHTSERPELAPLMHKASAACVFRETPTLEELTSGLRETRVFAGPDSGVLHVATGLGIPVVGLYGPGIIELFGPYGVPHRILHRQDRFPCAPCLHKQCLHPAAHCVDNITPAEVVEALRSLWLELEGR